MANLSNINNVLRVSSNLRVGINTDAASYALEIGGTNSGIKLKNSGASGKVYSILSDTSGNFQIYDDAAASGRLVIDTSGNSTFANSIFLPDNRDIGWNGGYSASKPTLAAVGTTMKMFPSGATSGAQFELTPTTATFAGNVTIDHSTNADSTLKLHAYSSAIGDAFAWNLTAENSANSYAFRILQGTSPVFTIANTASGATLGTATFAGNVGIGTTSPGVKLDVSGSSSGVSIRIKDSMGAGAYYYGYMYDGGNLQGTTQTNIFYAGGSVAANTTITDYASLRIDSPNVAASGAAITNNYGIYQGSHLQKNYFNGNVGIGVTSPTYKLQVAGTTLISGGLKVIGPGSYNSFQSGNNYTLGLNDSNSVSQWWLKAYTTGDFALHENAVGDQFTIQAGGNVGIGVTPTQKLDVNGQMTHDGLVMKSGTGLYVDTVTTFNITLDFVAGNWVSTGLTSLSNSGLTLGESGTYIMQIYSDDHSPGEPYWYSMYWSGIMSWYASNTNQANTQNPIVLQKAGHGDNNRSLEAQILWQTSSGTPANAGLLQLKCNATAPGTDLRLKFRRLI